MKQARFTSEQTSELLRLIQATRRSFSDYHGAVLDKAGREAIRSASEADMAAYGELMEYILGGVEVEG